MVTSEIPVSASMGGVQSELSFGVKFKGTTAVALDASEWQRVPLIEGGGGDECRQEFQPELPFEAAERAARRAEKLRKTGRAAGTLGKVALKTGLAVGGAMLALQVPYHTHAEGVPFKVQGSLLVRSGFSADTTFGNWEFPHVDG